MSKKIAEGVGGLVLDVKAGVGAFMKTLDDARQLARALVQIGVASGVRTEALITAMDAPLGRAVGNANEVIESIETLKGRGPAELEELSVRFAARMVVLAGICSDEGSAQAVRSALTSGRGVEKFRAIIEHQGGNPRVIDDYGLLPSTPDVEPVAAERSGYVAALHAEAVGRAAVSLGAGRAKLDDVVDPGVGITVIAPPGTQVSAGDPILEVRHRGGRGLQEAVALLTRAITIADAAAPPGPLVLDAVNE